MSRVPFANRTANPRPTCSVLGSHARRADRVEPLCFLQGLVTASLLARLPGFSSFRPAVFPTQLRTWLLLLAASLSCHSSSFDNRRSRRRGPLRGRLQFSLA